MLLNPLKVPVMNETDVHPPSLQPRQPAPDGSGPIHNARGVIAEHYRDLQGLPVLEQARAQFPLPYASAASTIRAVFQSSEIALLNLADLMTRAAADIAGRQPKPAMVKLLWARGFHRVLVRLSLLPQQLGLAAPAGGPAGHLCIADSPAFGEYVDALARFDGAMLSEIESGRLAIDDTIAGESLDSPLLSLIHAARVANHESTIWEDNLADVGTAVEVPSYDTFVSAAGMRAAVYDRVLSGDTYFTQFRGLHQIPETLGDEANDRLEQAIRALRAGRFEEASDDLRIVTILVDGMLASLAPMADNLATADYHEIRENLGLTSGSHSVCLRFHMFSDLYEQLSEALADAADRSISGQGPTAVAPRTSPLGSAHLQEPHFPVARRAPAHASQQPGRRLDEIADRIARRRHRGQEDAPGGARVRSDARAGRGPGAACGRDWRPRPATARVPGFRRVARHASAHRHGPRHPGAVRRGTGTARILRQQVPVCSAAAAACVTS